MYKKQTFMNRLMVLIMSIMMVLTMVPQDVIAAVGTVNTGSKDEVVVGEPVVYLSEEYAKVATQEDIDALKSLVLNVDSGLLKASPVYTEATFDEMLEYVKDCMVNRDETITVQYKTTSSDYNKLFSDIIDGAMKHTGVGNEGDYIERTFGGWTGNVSYSKNSSVYTYTFKFGLTYYTTKAQEDILANKIDEVLQSLDLEGKSNYEKLKLIYDYICANIVYDYSNDSSMLKYTAYAALVNKTAVCQGYSALLYRMLLETGIDTRIMMGLGNGGGHAWNIVKPDTYYYYYVDSTWDAVYKQGGYSTYPFFLKCLSNFGNHTLAAQGTQEYERINAIVTTYPIATSNYKVCSHNWVTQSVEKKATTSDDGKKKLRCTKCIELKDEVINRIGEITLSQYSYDYDGTAKKPSVVVKDCNGIVISDDNYDVVYSGNVEIGTGKVAVNFKNEYSGSVSKEFVIKGSNKPQVQLTAGDGKITATWDAVNGATNYRVFTQMNGAYTTAGYTTSTSYTIDGLAKGTKYGVLVLAYVNGAWTPWTTSDVKYATTLSATKPVPMLTVGDGQIKATWDVVNGASNYRIFTALNGVYTTAGYTTGTSFTISELKNGTNYGVLVLAYVNGAWSKWSTADIKYATPVASGENSGLTLTAGAGKITAKWSAVSGASNYRVFTCLNGVYTTVGYTTSTSYTITGLKSGTKYGVLVLSYVDGVWSKWSASDIKYATPVTHDTVPGITLEVANGQITAKWAAMSGASNYRVFTCLNGVYATEGYTTGTEFTIKELANGTKYGVLVLACVNGTWSKWSVSDIRYATPVVTGSAPTLEVTAGSGQITASWDAMSGASKYRVFKCVDGSYTTIADVADTSYTITGLTNGTKCGVLVLAYVNGAWSKWSASDVKYATPKA